MVYLAKEDVINKMSYQGKDGNIYYKLTQNKRCVIDENDYAVFEIVSAPGSKTTSYGGRNIMSCWVKMAPVTVNFDKKEFNYGEAINVGITASDYKYLTERMKVNPEDVVTVTGKEIQTKYGPMITRQWRYANKKDLFKERKPSANDPLMEDLNI